MIAVYKLDGTDYNSIAVIDEERAVVTGSSGMADYLREIIRTIEEDWGYDASEPNVMNEIRENLEDTYNNGYIEIR